MIRNKKISQVRIDKSDDTPTLNRALDNIINTTNAWIDDATQTINRLEGEIDTLVGSTGVTITPQNAAPIAGSQLLFNGAGGLSFSSNGSDTLTINQQQVTIAAADSAGFGQGNNLVFSGSGGATITRNGTTLTINPNVPVSSIVAGSNINVGVANAIYTISVADPINLTTISGSVITASSNIISPHITGSEITSSNFIGWGNRIVRPYGVFCDLTTQTASNTTTAYPMRFTTTEEALGVSIVNNSQITFAYAGTYNIQFSAQVAKSNASAADVDIWLSETGSNVPRSNTNLHIVGNNAANVAAWNFVRTFASGSYAEILWRTSDTDVELLYENSSSSPDRPEIPSTILTISQV